MNIGLYSLILKKKKWYDNLKSKVAQTQSGACGQQKIDVFYITSKWIAEFSPLGELHIILGINANFWHIHSFVFHRKKSSTDVLHNHFLWE